MQEVYYNFIKLALRISKHFKEMFEIYYGPEDIKKEVELEEIIPLEKLLHECEVVKKEAQRIKNEFRKIYILKHVRAFEALLKEKLGEKPDYLKQASVLFDINAKPISEKTIEELKRKVTFFLGTKNFDQVLEKIKEKEDKYLLTKSEIAPFSKSLLEEYKKITNKFLVLPEKDKVVVRTVSGKPWGAFNWYKGELESFVEINSDIKNKNFLLDSLMAHEIYPGHHAELSFKETNVKTKFPETTFVFLNTPRCTISEGIAECAFDFLKEYGLKSNENSNFFELLGDLRTAAWVNAAFLLHQENLPRKSVALYLKENSFRDLKDANGRLEFHLDKSLKYYGVTYWYGQKLVWEAYLKAKKKNKQKEFFNNLYSLPLCPTSLEKLE